MGFYLFCIHRTTFALLWLDGIFAELLPELASK